MKHQPTTGYSAQLQALNDQGVAAANGLKQGEIKKIETEMWNLKVKGTDVVAYSPTIYIGGLPDMILGSVKASKSKTMQEVIEFTTELMEDKAHAYAERQA
ncbi:hypothetical protein Tco_1201108 [Tanacetum coccineum]